MAKPVQLDIPPRDQNAELQKRLEEALSEHAGALLESLELIEVLHQQNVLSTLRGAVGARDSIVNCLAHAAAQPETIRAVRNLLALAKLAGRIDPEFIETIQRSVSEEFSDNTLGRKTAVPTLWGVARLFWSPPVRRALFATGVVLAGVGYYLHKDRPGVPEKV